jgi:hypothetical protein
VVPSNLKGLNAEQVDEWMRTLPNLWHAVHHDAGVVRPAFEAGVESDHPRGAGDQGIGRLSGLGLAVIAVAARHDDPQPL